MASYFYNNPHEHIDFAKSLRQQAPKAEQRLWFALRNASKNIELKFRRQHPLHPYIVDFACVKAKLIIELDGMSHDARQNYDAKREADLKKRGWTILRFSNEDVYGNIEGVVATILEAARKTSPALP